MSLKLTRWLCKGIVKSWYLFVLATKKILIQETVVFKMTVVLYRNSHHKDKTVYNRLIFIGVLYIKDGLWPLPWFTSWRVFNLPTLWDPSPGYLSTHCHRKISYSLPGFPLLHSGRMLLSLTCQFELLSRGRYCWMMWEQSEHIAALVSLEIAYCWVWKTLKSHKKNARVIISTFSAVGIKNGFLETLYLWVWDSFYSMVFII